MKQWFTTKELEKLSLVGLPKQRNKIIAKALREDWQRRPRNARGGGYEYHVSSLPLKARIDLDKRLGLSIENPVSTTENPNTEVTKAKNNSILSNHSQLKFTASVTKAEQFNHSSSKKAVMTAKGREAIVNKIESLKTPNTSYKEIINLFVSSYNQGDFKPQDDAQENIYEYITNLSVRTVTRYMKAYKEQGISGLLPNLEAKRATKLEQTEYRIVIVGVLTQYPHASNYLLFKMFEQKYPTLISYRTFCRFVEQYKQDHKQELMMATNPDAWKSKYKLAVGNR